MNMSCIPSLMEILVTGEEITGEINASGYRFSRETRIPVLSVLRYGSFSDSANNPGISVS